MLIQDITAIITVLSLVIGTTIGLLQWFNTNKIKRSEFLNQIIDKLRFDETISKVMYKIDYSEDWYNEYFHNSKDEIQFDKFFAYLNYIYYLRKNRIMKEKEFKFLRYELNRVCQNYNAQNYLWNLYHFSKNGNSVCPFNELVEYGLKEKIFEPEFKNNNSQKYTKYLNF